ncbi:hypothetical protein [Streptomyces sporangiiformans]|uniref:hypothetical protein n=1 Tax=Streptomyces sporangiiformans TaxID=2315329 RepID=UPI001F0891DD|nr:hypothetical protein [Streptomyces sporangiiformans]
MGDADVMDVMDVMDVTDVTDVTDVMDVSWWRSTASATHRVRDAPYAQRTAIPPP